MFKTFLLNFPPTPTLKDVLYKLLLATANTQGRILTVLV